MLTKFLNFITNSESQPNFRISTKFQSFRISGFQTNFKLWNTCSKILIWLTLSCAYIFHLFFSTLAVVFERFLLWVAFNWFFWSISGQREKGKPAASKVQLNFIQHKVPRNNKSYCYTLNTHFHLKLSQFIWLLFFTFQLCAFSNVSSNGLLERMHSHINCIFPLCVFMCLLK